jgi:hypothetical protein
MGEIGDLHDPARLRLAGTVCERDDTRDRDSAA